jgi:hypothetical protein
MRAFLIVNNDNSLSVPEWLFVVTMCCFLAFAGVSAWRNKQSMASDEGQCITVFVTGAVKQPKKVELLRGALLADALACVSFLPEVHTDALFYSMPLEDEQVVVVPKKGCVSVYIAGAVVSEQVVCLPEGSCFPALLKKTELFRSDADLRFLRRKRRLIKDGETVVVPIQKNKKKSDE